MQVTSLELGAALYIDPWSSKPRSLALHSPPRASAPGLGREAKQP